MVGIYINQVMTFKKLKELVEQHKFRDINKIMSDDPQDKHLSVKFYK